MRRRHPDLLRRNIRARMMTNPSLLRRVLSDARRMANAAYDNGPNRMGVSRDAVMRLRESLAELAAEERAYEPPAASDRCPITG